MRREAALSRGPDRAPLVRRGDRIAHVIQLRDGDSINGLLSATHSGLPINLAGDLFPVYSTINVARKSGIRGSGYATELRGSAGPTMNVTADSIVIENVRFVRQQGLPSASLITRPVRCSGDTYSPAALGTDTSTAALTITGDNVTVRNCWFDGFDNAIYSTGANTQVKCCYFKGAANSSKAGVYLAGTYGHVTGCYMDELAYGVYAAGDKSSISDNTILATETGIFVISDSNRVHGNHCDGHADGFAIVFTHDAEKNTVTGNVSGVGTMFFTTGKNNLYGANIATVDLE